MGEEFGYLKKEDRKKILLLSDDIRMYSGVATMSREFVTGTAHHFNWFQVGAAVKHPTEGKLEDISDQVNTQMGIDDAEVKILGSSGYGNAQLIRNLIEQESPDAIFIFTDPRYWIWLFDIEREIRSKIPIFWLNIWDDYPAPMYNKSFYNSVDVLMAISKQTENINRIVLGDDAKDKVIKYVPHGINEELFFPISVDHPSYSKYLEFKDNLFGGKEIDFVVFWNSRNIHRKRPGDVILSYRMFCDRIGKEKAKKAALIMHTQPVDQNGTDLRAVRDALCDPSYVNVFFSDGKLTSSQMNLLYNVADVSMLISSNEGWGLSLTESMMAGTMIIGAATGGMQDQMRFEDKDGNWLKFTPEFPSNNKGTYRKHGPWAVPVYPTSRALAGSPGTPYIFDDRVSNEDIADALEYVYELKPEVRKENGLLGRAWATGKEARMSAKWMSQGVIEAMEEGFEKFIPRPRYEVIKSVDRTSKYITHNIYDY